MKKSHDTYPIIDNNVFHEKLVEWMTEADFMACSCTVAKVNQWQRSPAPILTSGTLCPCLFLPQINKGYGTPRHHLIVG